METEEGPVYDLKVKYLGQRCLLPALSNLLLCVNSERNTGFFIFY